MALTEAVTANQAVTANRTLTPNRTFSADQTLTADRTFGARQSIPVATPEAGTAKAAGEAGTACFRPIPVWFFAFEGLMGAAYDVVKSSPDAWMLLAAAAVVNIALARTVLRGRLKMAKAMLKGRRTRKIALGLIALRIGVHLALGAIGLEATSDLAHLGLAALMCAATVSLLAFDQRVMLRALAA